VLGICLLLCRPWWRGAGLGPIGWIALPLRAVGSMPLSAYAGQIVAWWLLQPEPLAGESDLGAFRDLDPFLPFVAWTIIACTAWALLVGRGPLEWAVDAASRLAGRRERSGRGAVDRVDG